MIKQMKNGWGSSFASLLISPPFGNYIRIPGSKSIKGSFTLEPREGLVPQIVKTLRFSFEANGWINKIGLRNKGLEYGIKNYNHDTDILSIAIMNESEIKPILNMLPKKANIELNVSCPNVEDELNDNNIGQFLNPEREWCAVKISPLTRKETIDKYYKLGFRQYHCCNTLRVENGGLSGPSLIPYVCKQIETIKSYPNTTIVGGGGIQNMETLNKYKKLGATYFSLSSIFFHPIVCVKFFMRGGRT
tara:strand:- start:1165 stop:1905 length:741 start_codon:yes stop_codon:yes gene_type:complete